MRDRLDAWHEAAHAVVGVALGLRLRRVVLGSFAGNVTGWTHFAFRFHGGRRRVAVGAMYAAGIAWCAMSGRPKYEARGDVMRLAELGFSAHDRLLLAGIATNYLRSREGRRAQRRVAEALLERDLTGADVSAILSGDE